uniref:Chromatin-remodeling ATPase INO80 n=1 Tax=Ciona intestinalis TaxID=7719 RepID=F6T0R3_CIOIN|nr:chromatin-remodeling ATPase INO80 [Ciona intestinalis]|eukprot:XP_002119451.1 chromatin-remodeling ATPase INO80 [Ciona intestinalis]
MLFSRISSVVARRLTTNATKQGFLRSTQQTGSRRLMSGGGADISPMETAVWLIFGGIPIAAWGLYQTAQIKARVEAYDAGEIVPIKTLSNDEWLEFKGKVKERLAANEEDEDEDEDEDESGSETSEAEEATELQEEEPQAVEQENGAVRKDGKDTIIFVEK